jgi:phosphatidylglycerophosphatase A
MPGPTLSSLRDPVHFVALGAGSGLAPRAPGTAGTLVALVPAWQIAAWSLPAKLALIGALFVLGVWICGESARRLESHDHPAIVFDEIVGMLLAAALIPAHAGWFLLAFALFRLFDIFKPWPIRDLDHRLGGGLGIMLDDVLAAVYAMACLAVIGYLLSL